VRSIPARDAGAVGVPAHHVRLELWLDGDSLTGRATAPGESARQFSGWIGLVAAVEALVVADHEPGSDDDLDLASHAEDDGDGTVA
jgi:hypothetical protein